MKRFLILFLILSFSMTLLAREPLTFEQRVKAQEAIEKVYYNHRIWPKENKTPKPAFEKMVSKETIEAKVTDYLKKSAALEKYWYRPITGEQLQAEMDRMAKGTKDPGTLNELFVALNNDPYLIAECLARPILADRLVRNWYANDERFHKETREKAEEALKHLTHENFCSYSEGQYSIMTYRLENEPNEEREMLDPEDHSIGLSEDEFAKMFREIPDKGKISEVIEKDDYFFILHTIEKNEMGIVVEGVTFKKASAEEWLKDQQASRTSPETEGITYVSISLPPVLESECAEGWTEQGTIYEWCPTERKLHTAVWTGTEMIIWGGFGSTIFSSGGKYNPSTDSWTDTTLTNAAGARSTHTAVWTGSEMIVWGGWNGTDCLDTGGKYDPSSNSWETTSITDVPAARGNHTAVWSGTEMIIWGGDYLSGIPMYLNTGGRYNPSNNSWTATSTSNAPSARSSHTAVWTNTEMIIWGGYGGSPSNTGGRYKPSTDSWTVTSTTGAPEARLNHTAIWTGTEMIVWGGAGSLGNYLNTGGKYKPSLNSWVETTTSNAPDARWNHTAIWTGTKMIVWGGSYSTSTDIYLDTGGSYDPSAESWNSTTTTDAPSPRSNHTAVWTGSEMIIWGGSSLETQTNVLNTGARYALASDSWVPTDNTTEAPQGRSSHTAIWTGSEMIIWGGYDNNNRLQTGGRFNLSTDTWTPTTVMEAPSGRMYHTAVWTGTEMIVWGGHDGSNSLNTGGKYYPVADLWITVPTSAAPSERMGHTAVWTGTEMIVWGGGESGTIRLNTGSKYNPMSDNWIPMTTTDAPSARIGHRAIWTGNEMIVWGGINGSSYFDTGGRYSPSTDSWIATSTTGAPAVRGYHTAVWTGTEMIIWGGSGGIGNYLRTGGAYDPSTNGWTMTSTTDAPLGRYNHTAVWTGTEMIVWGGCGNAPVWKNDGGKYDPSLSSWISTPFGMNCPSGRNLHSAIWTGSEMIVWGGYGNGICYGSGAIYYFPDSPVGVNSEAKDNDGCSDSGVLVEWNLPSNWGDGYSGTRSFDVLRDIVQIAGDLPDSTTSFIDTTGSNGISYLYQVRANNGCDLSLTTIGTSAMDFVCTWDILYQSRGAFTEITGDGDSFFERGEKWSVPVTVTNSGNTPATNVAAILSGNGITVCDTTGSFGTITAGGTGTFIYNFVIDDDFTPCEGSINFNLGSKACTELTPAGADETNLFSVQVGQIAAGVPAELVLQPSIADSHVNQSSAGTNYGTATTMLVQARTAQARRSLVQFDISPIPEGSTVNSATLELYATNVTGGLTLNVHRITGTWTETGVTWTNQPAFTSTADASITGGTSTGWKIWDVASVVQQWVNGTANYGFIVKAGTETGLSAVTNTFASKENATAAYWPVLRINYTPPTSVNCDYVGSGICSVPLPGEAAPGDTYENGQMWSGTTQSWPVLSGATGYKLYRGVQSGLPNLLTTDNDSCLRYEGSSTSIDLSSDDPSGDSARLYWYIVTGTNGSGEGPAGNVRIVNSSGNCE